MIKVIFICDTCGKQRTVRKQIEPPAGWLREYDDGPKDYCSKKCRPRKTRRKVVYVSANHDTDPGVGSLYGRT